LTWLPAATVFLIVAAASTIFRRLAIFSGLHKRSLQLTALLLVLLLVAAENDRSLAMEIHKHSCDRLE
jgi:hypothetical protein